VSGSLLDSSPFGAAVFLGTDEVRVTAKGGGNDEEDSGDKDNKGKGKGRAKPVLPTQLAGLDAWGHLILGADLGGSKGLHEAATPKVLTFALKQNYPNPFNPETIIQYSLTADSEVRLVIYNILGQQVRELVNELQQPGVYAVRWDGTDESGYRVTSGVYLYRLVAGHRVVVRKMVLMK